MVNNNTIILNTMINDTIPIFQYTNTKLTTSPSSSMDVSANTNTNTTSTTFTLPTTTTTTTTTSTTTSKVTSHRNKNIYITDNIHHNTNS
eukprot:UN03532